MINKTKESLLSVLLFRIVNRQKLFEKTKNNLRCVWLRTIEMHSLGKHGKFSLKTRIYMLIKQ